METSNNDQLENAEIGIQLINATTNDNESHLKSIINRLERNIDSYCVGELKLPDIEIAVLLKCSNPSCLGKWQLHSEEILLKMRSRPRNENEEREALRCSLCGIRSSCTDRINAALEHGYLRCYKKSRPNKEEILNLNILAIIPKNCRREYLKRMEKLFDEKPELKNLVMLSL